MTPEEYMQMLQKKKYAMQHLANNPTMAASRHINIGNSLGVVDIAVPSGRKSQRRKLRGGKPMTVKEFCSLIAKKEGKKSQTSIGNIREIIKITNTILSKESDHPNALYKIIRSL